MPDAEFIQYEVTEDGDLLVMTPGFWDVLKAHATADPPLTEVDGTIRIPLPEVPGTTVVTAQGSGVNGVTAQANVSPAPLGIVVPAGVNVASALGLSLASGLQPRCELRISRP
jgi:hypothetical protein